MAKYDQDGRIRVDASLVVKPDAPSTQVNEKPLKPLLNEAIAATISKASTATRFSIRCTALFFETLLEVAKFSTSTSLAIGRQSLISSLIIGRSMHPGMLLCGTPTTPHNTEQRYRHVVQQMSRNFCAVLDQYTNLGIYFVHHSFSLAELLTLTSFHFTASTVRFSFRAAEETVKILDGLFGSTETSRALAAIVEIVQRELHDEEQEEIRRKQSRLRRCFSLPTQVVLLGRVAKATTAFACLQNLTACRKVSRLKLDHLFEFVVDYDRVRTPDENTDAGDGALWAGSEYSDLAQDIESAITSCPIDEDAQEDGASLVKKYVERYSTPRSSCELAQGGPAIEPEDSPSCVITTIDELPRDSTEEAGPLQRQPSIQSLVSDLRQSMRQRPTAKSNQRCDSFFDGPGSDLIPFSHAKLLPASNAQSIRHALPPVSAKQPTHVYPRRPLIQNLSRFLRYATGAYGKRFMRIFGIGRAPLPSVVGDLHHANHHVFATHVGISVDDVILSSYQPADMDYLTRDEADSAKRHNWFSVPSIMSLEAPRIHPLVHYLCVDHSTRSVVLALRGTLGLSDILTDLTCNYTSLELWVPADSDCVRTGHGNLPIKSNKPGSKRKTTFQAHAGILKSAESMANDLGAFVRRALLDYPDYGLIICGHSVAGAVAALLGVLWSDRFNDTTDFASARLIELRSDPDFARRKELQDAVADADMHRTASSSSLPPGRPLHCFTFGSPGVVSYELARQCSTLVTSVVHGDDVVPTLSLGLVKDLKSITLTLNDERNRGVAEKIITRTLGLDKSGNRQNVAPESSNASSTFTSQDRAQEQSLEEDWLWSLIQTLRADMVAEKLYPCGSIHWLRSKAYVRRTQRSGSSPGAWSSRENSSPQYSGARWDVVHSDQLGSIAQRPDPGQTTIQEERRYIVALDRAEDPQELLGEMKFSRSMFTDHNPRLYEDGIRALELGASGLTCPP